MSESSVRIQYDYQFDVLYCSIGDTSNSYGDQINDRVVVLRDITTNTVTGITILDHMKMIGSVE